MTSPTRRPRRRIGDRDVGDAGLRALAGQQVGVAAARGEPDDLEAVGVGGDDVERLGADRSGAAQDQHAQPVTLSWVAALLRSPDVLTEPLCRVRSVGSSAAHAEVTRM